MPPNIVVFVSHDTGRHISPYGISTINKPVLIENLGSLPSGPDRWDELYDLEADPLETNNLANDAAQTSLRNQLAGSLFQWMKDTNDPILRGPVASPRYFDRVEWLQERAL